MNSTFILPNHYQKMENLNESSILGATQARRTSIRLATFKRPSSNRSDEQIDEKVALKNQTKKKAMVVRQAIHQMNREPYLLAIDPIRK